MAEIDDPRVSLGTDPIPGGEPAGENIRDETEFETLSEEVSKMETDGPNAVDWRNVLELSEGMLRDRTKDFLVAAYYAYALGREEGVRGLAVGLAVLVAMVETYWESGFPPPRRERARVGAVDWLAGRFGPRLMDVEVKEDNADDFIAALAMADQLDRLLDEKAEKTQANLGDLLRPLREKKQDAEFIVQQRKQAEEAATAAAAEDGGPASDGGTADAVNASAAQSAPQPAAQPAPATAAPPATPSSSTPSSSTPSAAPPPSAPAAPEMAAAAGPELERAVATFRTTMLKFSRDLRAANPGDARAYSIHRLATWLTVADAPPVQGVETMLPAPDQSVVSTIETMAESENYEALIGACESASEDSLFWLDPHRHVANALGALGHEAARVAVIAQVGAFVGRLPKLLDLKFQGGHPFANDQTRLWLSETVLKSAAGGGGAGGEDDGVGEALSQARGLAANGKAGEAAQVLSDGRRSAAGRRSALLWDLATAELCLDMGLSAGAFQLLRSLDERHREIDLETWEPGLAERLTTLMLRSVQGGGAADTMSEEAVLALTGELSAALYRLNLSSALQIMRPS